MTHDSMIEVIAAHRDGKAIEARCKRTANGWVDFTSSLECVWDTYTWDYRIKPAPPKPREWWIFPVTENTLQTPIFLKKPANHQSVHVREVLPSTGEEFKITLNQSVLMWLGQWRDKMPVEAVSELQEVLNVPKKT